MPASAVFAFLFCHSDKGGITPYYSHHPQFNDSTFHQINSVSPYWLRLRSATVFSTFQQLNPSTF
ncbi:hypothetical protein [Lutibacter sp.]|uniref:hypothetical protein n=1 Tax=Lutibacter sp. TaxID=1925666 RepID=UPI0034A08C56